MSTPAPEPGSTQSTTAPATPAPESFIETSAAPRPRHVMFITLAAGLVAALLSWGAGEATLGWFQAKRAGNAANAMEVQFDNAELNRTDVKNAALSYGIQGAILGLVLGLAGGTARRSVLRAVLAALTGLVVGGAVGASGSFGAFTAYFRLGASYQGELLPSVLAHVSAWAPVGAIGGFAFGLGLGGGGRMTRALIGGLVGAAVGALLFDVAGSVALPLSKTGDPIAASASARLIAHAAVCIFTALGAGLFSEAGSVRPRT